MAWVARPAAGTGEVWEVDAAGDRTRRSPEGQVAFAPAWSRCGARLAYVTHDPATGFTVHVVDGAVARAVGESVGPISDVDWTADGSGLVYPRVVAPGQELVLLDVASGATRVIARRDDVRIGQVAVNPVSGRLAVSEVGPGGRPGQIRFLEPDGSEHEAPIPGLSPAWSPDGAALAYVTENPSGWTLSVRADDHTRAVFHDSRLLYNPAWSDGRRALLFERSEPGGTRIWTADVRDGKAWRLPLAERGVAVGSPAPRPKCP